MTRRVPGKASPAGSRSGWDAARDDAFAAGLATTVEQRVAWFEEMLEIARSSGALANEVERRARERGLTPPARRPDP